MMQNQTTTDQRANDQGLPDDSSTLNRVMQENIRTIIQHRQQAAHRRTAQERIADVITDFSGSMMFVLLHVAWFAAWFLLNTGWFFKPFDPFPYSLLTMVVSLEAIFLSTFVLISANRTSREDEERADLDLQINLLTERELTRVLQMLDELQDRLGIANDEDIELAELEQETKPEEVLKEIERHERSNPKHESSV